MEKAREYVSHRPAMTSSSNTTTNDQHATATLPANDGDKPSKLKRRSVQSDDSTLTGPFARVLPDRLIERTREKKSERNHYRKCNDLKLAFSEFYLMLVLLQNYQTLNFTGFRKILKKHDKLFQTTRGEDWRWVDHRWDLTRSFASVVGNYMSIQLPFITRNVSVNWSTTWKPCSPMHSNRAIVHERWSVYAFHLWKKNNRRPWLFASEFSSVGPLFFPRNIARLFKMNSSRNAVSPLSYGHRARCSPTWQWIHQTTGLATGLVFVSFDFSRRASYCLTWD